MNSVGGIHNNHNSVSGFIYCPKCGRQYLKSMRKCPQCGYVIDRAPYIKWIVIGIIAVIFLFVVLAAKGGRLNSDYFSLIAVNTATEDYIEVSWETLLEEYEANQIAADEKYKGKNLKVTGDISDFERDFISDKPCIVFGEHLARVIAVFDKGDEEKVGALSKGDNVTIIGKCEGATYVSECVYLRSCQLVQ